MHPLDTMPKGFDPWINRTTDNAQRGVLGSLLEIAENVWSYQIRRLLASVSSKYTKRFNKTRPAGVDESREGLICAVAPRMTAKQAEAVRFAIETQLWAEQLKWAIEQIAEMVAEPDHHRRKEPSGRIPDEEAKQRLEEQTQWLISLLPTNQEE